MSERTVCDRCGENFAPGTEWLAHRAACQVAPEGGDASGRQGPEASRDDPAGIGGSVAGSAPALPSDKSFERPCKGCGRHLLFVRSDSAPFKWVPLERLDRYETKIQFVNGQATERAIKTPEKVYINHFQTCPRAADFHKKG